MELVQKAQIREEASQLAYYRRALPTTIRTRISYSYPVPATIQEWMSRTLEIDHAYRINKELDGTQGRTRKRETQKQVRATNTEEGDTPEINKLTTAERRELITKNLCFRCKKPGHISRNCPTRPNRNRPPKRKIRQVLEEEESGSSGEEADTEQDEDSEEEDINIQTIPTNIDEYSETDF